MADQLTVLIVEDEVWPRKHMTRLVEEAPSLKLGGIASNVRQFAEEVRKHSYDLILLDIGLHGESSFDFLKESRFQGCVIVTTGSRDHAIDAFDLDVVDYLLKPVQKKRFEQAVEKALIKLGRAEAGAKESTDEESLERLEKVLSSEYDLSKTEVAICVYIYRGVERSQIEEFLEIGFETLKSHLRKIYKKTIEKDAEQTVTSHGKFQKLTTFLYSLKI